MQDYLLLHKWQNIIAERDADLFQRAESERFKSQSRCQKYAVFVPSGGGNSIQGVGLYSNGKSSRFSNLFRCKSSWSCPVCSELEARHYKEVFDAVIRGQAAVGNSAIMVTYTVPHMVINKAGDVLRCLSDTWRKVMHSNATIARYRKSVGCVGSKSTFFKFVRVTEVTYTRNGWHFHYHTIFFGKKADLERFWDEYEEWLSDKFFETSSAWWEKHYDIKPVTNRRNLQLGLKVSRNKNGTIRMTTPKNIIKYLTSGWNLKTELTEGFGMGDKKLHEGSRHVFELLASDDKHDNALFVEYALATLNKPRVRTSPGLIDDADFEGVENSSEEAEVKKKYVLVAWWLLQDWYKIIEAEMRDKVPHRYNLALVGRRCSIDDIIAYCEAHGIEKPLSDNPADCNERYEEYAPRKSARFKRAKALQLIHRQKRELQAS